MFRSRFRSLIQGAALRGSAVLLAAAVLAASAPWRPAVAETFDIISKLSDTSAATVWRVDAPDPKVPQKNYPGITFLPGDVVSVDAGGCVQTGGHGRTWKRYVDPSGPNADHLYHGLIHIPGVNDKLVRLQNFGMNSPKQISDPLPAGLSPAAMFLQLGYEDDGYGDNGYYAHDDGTEDQCKNVSHAWLIVSIGHNGALPPSPAQFVGILPSNFRCQAAWSFRNFNTGQLSWNSFTSAFQLGTLDYLDPATYITFLAARGNLASSGNCMGMSLLADVGEDQFVVGDLRESFWHNYKTNGAPTGALAFDINVAHWKQLSSYFLRHWLTSMFDHPEATAAAIEHDLTSANYNYGLLSLAHGTEGHVLVPLRVSRSGSQTLIDVYDPNRPCGGIPDTATYPQLTIANGRWSYLMADGSTWSGTSGADNAIAYVPYIGDNGWSDLGTDLSGVAKIIFGGGVVVEQVADRSGRQLYVQGQPGVLDTTPNGLFRSVIRLPRYATGPQRPRNGAVPFVVSRASAATPAINTRLQQLETEYADYAATAQIFLVPNVALNDLTFTLSGTNAANPVRALVSQGTQFLEVRAAGTGGALLHPTLAIKDMSNLASGLTFGDRNGAAAQVVFSHGLVAKAAGTVTMQRTDTLAPAPSLGIQIVGAQLQVMTTGTAAATRVTSQVLNAQGGVTTAAPRQVMMLKAQ